MDPRLSVIDGRLASVKRIISVSGGKGGIGKSVLSASLAAALRRAGRKVGLLDLDFSSPSIHMILGAQGRFPEEENGIIPPDVDGIRLMSMSFFSADNPAPLRGADISSAMIELLAITRWGELDYLIVDMPPGLSDASLDVIRLMRNAETLIVAIPSRLSLLTAGKVVRMLQELRLGIVGVIENMRTGKSSFVEAETKRFGVPFLGTVGFDEGLEDALGDPSKLSETSVTKDVERLAGKWL